MDDPLPTGAQVLGPTANDSVLAWIKQRAHGDPPMLRAAADRDATPGAIDDPGDDKDLVTVLTRDHDQVVALVQQLSAIPSHKKGGSDWQIRRRESIADMIAKRLTVHEEVEDKQLWPLVQTTLADGAQWAADGKRQEQEAAQTLEAIRAAQPDTDQFDELVEKLTMQLRRHVAHEERVFLSLADELSDKQRQRGGRKAVRTKRAVAAKQEITDPGLLRPARRKGKAPGEARAKKSEADKAEQRPANTSRDDG
jgi:hemerythrin-like domain-containing protein